MSVDDFRNSMWKFEKKEIGNFLKESKVNTLQEELGCVSI